MKKTIISVFVALTAATSLLSASANAAKYDVRGKTKSQVKSIYGEPIAVKGPIGGLSAKRPPITEWDYGHFYITFEKNIALHGNDRDSLQMTINQ